MMKKFVKRKRSLILLIIGILLCSSTGLASAETLRMLVWEGYAPEKHQQVFIQLIKEKYGVDLKLEVKYVNAVEDFFFALRDRETDIISPSHNIPKDKRYRLIDFKLVLPLDLNHIPNYKNVIPDFQKTEYWAEGNQTFGISFSKGTYGLVYNTAIISEPPESWNILWDPKFKNKYTISKDYYEANIYMTALAMGFSPKDMSDYKKLNRPEFHKKLAELVINAHSLWEGVDKPDDLKGLAIGTSWGTSLYSLREMGEIWNFAETKEISTAWVDTFMISHTLKDNPKLKHIAEEWLNYALSDDYQLYILREAGYEPVTTSIKEKLTPEEAERLHIDDPTHFEKHRVLWPILEKTDRKGLQRLWEKALEQRKK